MPPGPRLRPGPGRTRPASEPPDPRCSTLGELDPALVRNRIDSGASPLHPCVAICIRVQSSLSAMSRPGRRRSRSEERSARRPSEWKWPHPASYLRCGTRSHPLNPSGSSSSLADRHDRDMAMSVACACRCRCRRGNVNGRRRGRDAVRRCGNGGGRSQVPRAALAGTARPARSRGAATGPASRPPVPHDAPERTSRFPSEAAPSEARRVPPRPRRAACPLRRDPRGRVGGCAQRIARRCLTACAAAGVRTLGLGTTGRPSARRRGRAAGGRHGRRRVAFGVAAPS